MSSKFLALGLAALIAGTTSAASALESSTRHAGAHARLSDHPTVERPGMIEVRPGLFVGNYQCADARGRSCDSSN